jgi:hypothetical protein
MEDMNLKVPPPRVDLDAIARKYHAAAAEQKKAGGKASARPAVKE